MGWTAAANQYEGGKSLATLDAITVGSHTTSRMITYITKDEKKKWSQEMRLYLKE